MTTTHAPPAQLRVSSLIPALGPSLLLLLLLLPACLLLSHLSVWLSRPRCVRWSAASFDTCIT